MKKLFLLLISVLVTGWAFSQVCIPGIETKNAKGYILPDSASGGLIHACPGHAYEEIIYIKAPIDTSFSFQGLPITPRVDSFVVDSTVAGLPAYLKTESNPGYKPASTTNPQLNYPHLVILGDSLACIKISGTVPASATPGSYPLQFNIRGYLTEPNFGLSIDTSLPVTGYTFVIDSYQVNGCFRVSVNNLEDIDFKANIYPNPTSSLLNVDIYSLQRQNLEATIIDPLGRLIYRENRLIHQGNNHFQLNLTNRISGFYILNLRTDYGSINKPIQIE